MTAPTKPEPDLVGALRAAFETLIAGGPDEVHPAEAALRAEIERLKAIVREPERHLSRLRAAMWESAENECDELKARAERDALRDAHALCREDANDNALWDNTPGAHPAFWRGQDDGVRGTCRVIEKALAGDTEGKCQELIQAVRDKIAALKADRDRLAKECRQLGILADAASDITWGGEQGWMAEGFLPKLGPALRKRFNDLYKDRDRLARLLQGFLLSRGTNCDGSHPAGCDCIGEAGRSYFAAAETAWREGKA